MLSAAGYCKSSRRMFVSATCNWPDVVDCHNIAGTFEYLLRVESQDLASYKRFHTEMLGTQPHVSAITTHIVMSSPKDERR